MFKQCPICSFRSESMRQYVLHAKLHRNTPNTEFACPFCDCYQKFTTYIALRSHVLRKHSETSNVTNHEELSYRSLSLSVHQYKCEEVYCEQICTSFTLFKSHLKSHLDNNMIVACPFKMCHARFRVKSSFTAHLSRKHRHWSDSYMKSHILIPAEVDTITSVEQSNQRLSNEPDASETEQDVADKNESFVEHVNENDSFDQHVELVREPETEILSDTDRDHYLEQLALFYLKIQTKYLIPATTVQNIIEEMNVIHELEQENRFEKISVKLKDLGIKDEIITSVQKEISDSNLFTSCVSEPKGPLRTEATRKSFYKKKKNFCMSNQKKLNWV